MKRPLLILCLVLPIMLSAQLTSKSMMSSRGRFGFYEFKPAGYNPDSTYNYPLIIFMHGVGERGNGTTELYRVFLQSFPRMISEGATMKFVINGKPEAFLVLMPQMAMIYPNWQPFYIDSMLSYAHKNLKIDTNKIFVTGWSLGGGGAWKYTTASLDVAKQVSGIVLAAASPDYTHLQNLAKGNVAVWAFHARDDASVPIHFTEDAVEGVNIWNPQIPARMTYYAKGGHPFTAAAVYDTLNTYQYPNIYQWMAGTSKKNTLSNNLPPIADAGHDTTIYVPDSMVLNGSGSIDPNDVIVRYKWNLISGPNADKIIILNPDYPHSTVTNYELGEYRFRLTVVDEFNVSRSDEVLIRMALPPQGQNARPSADAGEDFAAEHSTCFIKGAGRDYDGTISRYHWKQISGPSKLKIHEYNKLAEISNMNNDGEYVIELTTEDNHLPAALGKDTVMITKKGVIPAYFIYWNRGIASLKGKEGIVTGFLFFIILISVGTLFPFTGGTIARRSQSL